jgi:hypothetical protein
VERGRSREKGESELSRFISLILGRRHLVSDTCLGKEEFWLLEGRVRSDEGARRVGQGKIRELAPEPVQCPSVLTHGVPYRGALCCEPQQCLVVAFCHLL